MKVSQNRELVTMKVRQGRGPVTTKVRQREAMKEGASWSI